MSGVGSIEWSENGMPCELIYSQIETYVLVKDKLRQQLKLRDRARARDSHSSPVALKTFSSTRNGASSCPGCLQCPLHCKDHKTGTWRPAPSTRGPSSRRAMQATASDDSGDEDNYTSGDDNYEPDCFDDVLRKADEAADKAAGEARALYLSQHLDAKDDYDRNADAVAYRNEVRARYRRDVTPRRGRP
jgi:hypothetical protein